MFDWDEYYRNGGTSGRPEDYAKMRDWKLDIVKRYCNYDTDSVLDIACGDLQNWGGILPTHYTGVDISTSIIYRNATRFLEDDNKTFIAQNAALSLNNVRANVVICFDVLWHIPDIDTYTSIIRNLKSSAVKTIMIYTWNRNPWDLGVVYRIWSGLISFKKTGKFSTDVFMGDGEYQKYWNFLPIANSILPPEFKLVEQIQNPIWKHASMYVWERVKQ